MKNLSLEESTQKMADLYHNGMTLEEIGIRFGMTRQGVRERFIKAGIDRRRPKTIDKDHLETLYSKDKLPIPEIAASFSVSIGKIMRALKLYGIPSRKPLKLGGFIVDFLRSLKIGETGIIKWRNNKDYAHLHHTAKRVGIRISIKSLGSGEFEIIRLE